MRHALIAVAVLAAGCASYPKERGERLEQRVDRIDSGADVAKLDGERAAARQRLEQLEARVAELQKQLETLAIRPPAETERTASGASAELAKEVERQRATIAEQQQRLSAMERTLSQLQTASADDRRRAGRTPVQQARTPPAAPAQPVRRAPDTPSPSASTPDAAASAPVAPKAAAGGSDAAGFLSLARDQERAGQKAVARDMYEQFVASHPEDPAAAEAHFRLGELAYGEKRYKDAVGEYGKVAQRFPSSGHAPDALLKTAESFVQMGLADEAVTLLRDVPKRYPGTPAASRATKRIAELRSSSR